MQEALREAKVAEMKDEVPVGAIVVLDNEIIGRGHNLRQNQQDPCAHAEILAIQNASKLLGSWRLIGCTVYITLEPCPMCLGALQQARVSQVFYGAKDEKGGALSLGYSFNADLRLNHRFNVEFFETSECSQLLKDYFQTKRTVKK